MRHAGLLVVAILLAGCAEWWSAPAAVDVGLELEGAAPVELFLPAHGARVDGRLVAFTWRAQGEELFPSRLLLDGAPVDGCPVALRSGCNVTLEPGRVYRWSVEVATPDGPLRGGERGFVTNAPPGPVRFDPGDEGATQVPIHLRLEFQPARDPERDAVTYRLVVRNASGDRVACEAAEEPVCELPFPLRPAERVTLLVTPRDAFGLEGPTSSVNVTTRRPLVLLHGWTGDATTWAILATAFEDEGFPLLDANATAPGVQPLLYRPDRPEETIEEMARTKVLPEIRRALRESGFAEDQPVDVVAHSMGGLAARWLIEKENVTQFATLVMVGTPNRGSPVAGERFCRVGDKSWYESCVQMEAGSGLLRALGDAPTPEGTTYLTIGGTRDSIVPDFNARLSTVPHVTVRNACHSPNDCLTDLSDEQIPLTASPDVLAAVVEALDVRPG